MPILSTTTYVRPSTPTTTDTPHDFRRTNARDVETHYALRLVQETPRGVGYLLKDRVADVNELTEAIRRVAAGGLVIDPAVVGQLVNRSRVRNPLDDLTERERDVLALMAEGRSNTAIGQTLFLSEKTVEAHIRTIFGKLNLAANADDNRRVRAVLTYLSTGH